MNEHTDHLNAALQGRYTIQRELGSGGMATVYLAEDLKHSRRVAIKVLRPELAASLGVERFVREIEIAANLTHPHILGLHDSGEADGFLYYVMPFIEGESLRERIDREGKLDVREAIRLTDQIASALSHAHARGLVHRDIKPENILLAGDRAIVADFGIARAVEVAGGERLTGTGLAVGTPAYMSPEQAMGSGEVDARSDVYALGCVVYEMVAGRAPFEGATPQELLAKHALDTAPSLRTSDPTIPLFLERAVERALAKRPDERFQSASEFAEALTSEIVVARVGGPRWPQRAIAAAAIIVVLVAGGWGLSSMLGGPAYERLAVLPPANLTNDPEQEYFVEGVHNALIAELQRAGVAVIARTSVLQYENTQKPIRQIAAELRVDALVEPSLFRAGDSLEIEVLLVDGSTEEYLADPIARSGELRNVMALYRDLSRAIAAEIRLALTPQGEAHLASARPVDPQAYEAYLKGRSHFQRGTQADLDQAFEYYQQALLLDSTYALAQAGIAAVWVNRAVMWFTPPWEAAPHAIAAAQRALALDSTLADVHSTLAAVRHMIEWDWEGAEAAFRKAIEINPNSTGGRAFYALHLSTMERPDEARAQMERALALDLYNPWLRSANALTLCDDGRYAECIEEYQAALRIEPDYPMALFNLVGAYHRNGNYDAAFAQLRRSSAGDQELVEALDRGYAEGGYRAAMRRYAETLAARPAAERICILVANAYAWAGDKERTLAWLERAYQAHDPALPMNLILTDRPELHDDPRFHDLRRRVGLPQ